MKLYQNRKKKNYLFDYQNPGDFVNVYVKVFPRIIKTKSHSIPNSGVTFAFWIFMKYISETGERDS